MVVLICRFVCDTIPTFLHHRMPPVDIDSTPDAAAAVDPAIARDAAKQHFYLSMLAKYRLVLTLLQALFAHDFQMTRAINEQLARIHKRRTRSETISPKDEALLADAEIVLGAPSDSLELVSSHRRPSHASSSRSVAVPHFQSALRESFRRCAHATLQHFQTQLLAPLALELTGETASRRLAPEERAAWLDMLEGGWLDLIMHAQEAKL